MKALPYIGVLLLIDVLLGACKQPDPKPTLQYEIPIYYQSSAVVTTIAGRSSIDNPGNIDGNINTARFGELASLAFDSQNNLFVVDNMFGTIRKITPSGDVTTFAGNGINGYADGTGKNASFNKPIGIVVDPDGNLYIADGGNNCIRKITPTGEVTTFAGMPSDIGGTVDGTGNAAKFFQPRCLALDNQGNLYVTQDSYIRKITPTRVVTTLASDPPYGFINNPAKAAFFLHPAGIGVGPDGNIYVADSFDRRIRKITPSGNITIFAGSDGNTYADGIGIKAVFENPISMIFNDLGDFYMTDLCLIRKVTHDSIVTSIAGGNGSPYSEDGIGCKSSLRNPTGIDFDAQGNLYVTERCLIRKIKIQ